MQLNPKPYPTSVGKSKYPPNGFIHEDDEELKAPCTCDDDCSMSCKGECGCKACQISYSDFLSME